MLTSVIDKQGIGPRLGGTAPHEYFSHGGANEGYRCFFIGYVNGDGAVVMTSGDNGGEVMMAAIRSIAAAYEWPDFAPPERVLSNVDPSTFDRYVGTYKFDDGGPDMTIWRDGDRMYSRVKEAPITELFATSEHEYFQRALPARFEFKSDALILHEGEGQDRSAKRLSAAESKKPLEEALAAGRRVKEQRAASGGEAMLRRVLASVASGKPDYAVMTADQVKDVREQLPELRTTMSALGALKAVRFQKVLESGIDHYVLEFEKGTADTAIELDRDGRLSGWWMQRR
ncbi:MAG TPA: hypothetical protein VJS12_07005 [Steroidobacteraceae bacterium]|nr:hypothetical protein [Steroidobacteraceae bacterium]